MTLAAPIASLPAEERDVRRGVSMMLIGLALFSILNGLVKALTETFAVNQIIFFRNSVALITLLLMAHGLGGLAALRVSNRRGMMVQAALFTGVLGFIFLGYRNLPLADATAISFLQPILVLMLSAPLLGERVTKIGWIALGLGLCGVSLMVHPTGNGSYYGVIMCMIGTVFSALSLIQQRSLSRNETSLAIAFWTLAGSALIMLPTIATNWVMPTPFQWALLVGNGLASGACQYLTTRSLYHAPVAMIAPLKYTSMIWAVIIGFIWFGDVPTLPVVIGSMIVIMASALVYMFPKFAPTPAHAGPAQ
jgi:drug/metabolite transporter (DMT)-like permease